MVSPSSDIPFQCPGCGAAEAAPLRAYRGTAPGFVEKSLVRCGGCELVVMHPFPTDGELDAYYGSYWRDRETGKRSAKFVRLAEARARFLASHLPERDPLRIIDVGAGFGYVATALSKILPGRRLEYDAVEIDPDAVRFLKETVKPRAVLERVEDGVGPYDLVVMSHFLEHLKSPLEYLRTLRSLLASGGILLVEVPNADYRFKDHEQPHLVFFAPKTLTRMIESAGMKVVKVDTCGLPTEDIIRMAREKGKTTKPAKRPLWKRAIKAVKRALYGPPSEQPKFDEQLDCYGGDRRWIRLLAVNPTA